MYNEFADHVLSAEKTKGKITRTMRVIAMPESEVEATPRRALIVAWTLKALLEGLPGGILGSTRLYEALRSIYFSETDTSPRVRLISLAIIALTSEMQCALICAIFGLLTGILQDLEHLEQQELSGNAFRPVASVTDADQLARVFGPLLVGTSDGDSRQGKVDKGDMGDMGDKLNKVDKVEREVEEQRVAGLLLKHWCGVSRKMREWASGSGNPR